MNVNVYDLSQSLKLYISRKHISETSKLREVKWSKKKVIKTTLVQIQMKNKLHLELLYLAERN